MGKMAVEWLIPPVLIQNPCSATWLLAQLFQKPSPVVETQLPFTGLCPDSKGTRDHRVTCTSLVLFLGFSDIFSKKITEESFKLYFQSVPLTSPLILKIRKTPPLKFSLPSILKKKTHTLVNPHSSFLPPQAVVPKHFLTQISPHLRHVKSDCAERYPRDGQQGICSVTALKSWWG